jgi:hypothetical protein
MAVRDDPPAAVEEIGRGRVGPIGSFLFEASGQRKGSGSYYTPRTIAAFLAREALEPLIEGRSSEEILLLRVIDPSMGSGAFLAPRSTSSPRPTARRASPRAWMPTT